MKRVLLVFVAILLVPPETPAQGGFTRGDSLRGGLSPERTCYDVTYYHLDVRVDPAQKAISGSNLIRFRAVSPFTIMQVDLFPNMEILSVRNESDESVSYTREFGAVFLRLPSQVRSGSVHEIRIMYRGMPVEAARPPWSGGFTWTTDEDGKAWVSVSCQGTGASLWWPNKDHQADEPDSMLISVTVPPGLFDVSNGTLRSITVLEDHWRRFSWFVANPINNYNVTVNIGNYLHLSDSLVRAPAPLRLDYYVLPWNREKALAQFAQVPSVLRCYEKYFGPYPFEADGYKLVETPYLGMEHQSAIAYGNRYMNGYAGAVQSAVGPSSRVGLDFDFIIVHESAHEWWGNSITSKDIADMWIHESFGAYAEAVFVEERWGYETALDYINAKKSSILNDRPIIGIYGVQNSGSGDMYNKGQLILNTLRHVIDNDSLWWGIVKGLATHFRMQTVTAGEVFGYIGERAGMDLAAFFNQYFRTTGVPELQATITSQGERVTMKYRWNADMKDFAMPVKVTTSGDGFEFIYPTTSWQEMELKQIDPREFRIADDLFYATLDLRWIYLVPEKDDKDFLRP